MTHSCSTCKHWQENPSTHHIPKGLGMCCEISAKYTGHQLGQPTHAVTGPDFYCILHKPDILQLIDSYFDNTTTEHETPADGLLKLAYNEISRMRGNK